MPGNGFVAVSLYFLAEYQRKTRQFAVHCNTSQSARMRGWSHSQHRAMNRNQRGIAMSHQATAAVSSTLLSPEEELANRITHGIGFVLSLAGVMVMAVVLGSGDTWRVAGCSVYLASLITVYAMSTLSHTFETPRLRTWFRALDQGAIYLLIAATYTPFSMVYLHTVPWWILLG